MSEAVSRERYASVVAGGFAGICSTCITNPLDTIRVRLAASRSATGKTHKSLLCHARELFGGGMASGFRAGLLPNLMASMPSNAVYLSTYRFLSAELRDSQMNHHAVPIVGALGSVFVTNITLGPMFLIRTQCQVDSSKKMLAVAAEVYRSSGVRGFWRGTLTNVAGRFVEEATFWYVFEFLKRTTKEGHFEDRNFFFASIAVVGLSGVSKLIGSSLAYPYNVVMTHLRTVNKATGQYEHTKILPTIRHIYRADGFLGFYKGLAPQLLRSVISKATQIYSFELAMSVYIGKNRQKVQPV
jgi:hypothetical protein